MTTAANAHIHLVNVNSMLAFLNSRESIQRTAASDATVSIEPPHVTNVRSEDSESSTVVVVKVGVIHSDKIVYIHYSLFHQGTRSQRQGGRSECWTVCAGHW